MVCTLMVPLVRSRLRRTRSNTERKGYSTPIMSILAGLVVERSSVDHGYVLICLDVFDADPARVAVKSETFSGL